MQTDKELQQDHRSRIALALMLALLIALVGGAVVRAWPLAANALAQEATSDQIADSVVLAQVTIQPTLPAPSPEDLTMDLQVGPNPFCPSYRLHYNLTLTNTTGVRLDDLVITASLPIDTYNPVDGGSTVVGVLTPDQKAMVWEQGSIEPGEVMRSYVIVHSYSTASAGTVLTTTFVITSPNLSTQGEIAGGVTANPAVCPPPTATPTITPSPTTTPPDPTPTTPAPDPTPTTPPDPTPEPTVPAPTPEPWMFLPLVTNEGTP